MIVQFGIGIPGGTVKRDQPLRSTGRALDDSSKGQRMFAEAKADLDPLVTRALPWRVEAMI